MAVKSSRGPAEEPVALSCVALVVKHSPLVCLPVDIALFLVSLLDQSHRWTLEQASQAGHVHLLTRLVAQEWPDAGRMFRKFRYRSAILKAATSGQLRVLQWWLFSYLNQPLPPNYEQIFGLAVKYGHLDILQWLQRQCVIPTESAYPIECDRPAVIRWLHDRGSGAMLVVSVAKAASVGDLAFLSWLHEREAAFFCVKHWLQAVSSAACGGHLELVKWLHKRQPSPEFVKSALNGAVQGGHLQIAQWVYARCANAGDTPTLYCRSNLVAINAPLSRWLMDEFAWSSSHDKLLWLQSTLLLAARLGDLEVLALLYEHRPPMRPANKLLGEAAAHGHLPTVKWLQASGEKYHRSIAIKAATHGHLNVLRWLLPDMLEECRMYATRAAASSGHLEIIQWLMSDQGDTIDWFSHHEIQNAAKNGHLETVKWLHAQGVGGEVNLDIVAAHGHLEIVAFMVSHCGARCSSAGLFAAARKGHFAMMEWLFRHDPHIVDPSHLTGLFA